MWIVQHRNLFFILSGIVAAVALVLVVVSPPRFGIDFTGGTLLEVTYPGERPAQDRVQLRLDALDIGTPSLRASGPDGYFLRTKDLSEEERGRVLDALSLGEANPVEVARLTTIGPAIGAELRNKAIVAMSIVVLLIIIFIAWAFRNVQHSDDEESSDIDQPRKKKKKKTTEEEAYLAHHPGVSSWTYGLIAIVALLHDILIPLGVFAVLGAVFGAEIDVLFVMALLAILGYSVNDTIVVFDRVRENLVNNFERKKIEDFEDTVGRSLDATITRSVNTSLTTLFVLVTLAVWGGETTQFFAYTLIAGIVAGTYSSIFLAPPLLVAVEHWKREKKQP